MAGPNDITLVAPGVTRTQCYWGHYFEGKRANLIAAGVAQDSWFPDGVTRNYRGEVIRTSKLEHEGRNIQVRQDGRRDWYTVHWRWPLLSSQDMRFQYAMRRVLEGVACPDFELPNARRSRGRS